VDKPTRIKVAQWLEASRGAQTQEKLAEDITVVTGWRIDRSRYSKYESGSLPIGPKVYKHFLDYWKARGVDGPDLTTRSPAPVPDLATVLQELSRELTEMRGEREAVRTEAAALRASRAAWERGVVAVLRAGAAGRVPADLLDALAPQPPVETRP